jgi:hypothetical protein
VHGLIKRVHNFPLLADFSAEDVENMRRIDAALGPSLPHRPRSLMSLQQHRNEHRNGEVEKRKLVLRAAAMMDGQHCDDELVCALDLPLERIFELFRGKRIVSVFATETSRSY